jgi:hypothetical protein
MKFVIIDPKQRAVMSVNCEDIIEAQKMAGLGNVDHGVLGMSPRSGIGYCVDEYGLFDPPPAEQSFCGCAGRLIAGSAVLYGFDEAGETIDLMKSAVPDVHFYLGVNDVEAAIDRGEIKRPIISVGDAVIWQWPQPQVGV